MLALVTAAGGDPIIAGASVTRLAIEPLAVPDSHEVIQAAFLGREALLELFQGRGLGSLAHADFIAQIGLHV
jgi:hypothetical protein